jgi:mRNA interferase YafQ
MLAISRTGQFKRDVKKAAKRGKDLDKLATLIRILVDETPLPASYRDNPLKGDWKHHRDVHIEPDWILIYRITDGQLILVRTGSHADLFGI